MEPHTQTRTCIYIYAYTVYTLHWYTPTQPLHIVALNSTFTDWSNGNGNYSVAIWRWRTKKKENKTENVASEHEIIENALLFSKLKIIKSKWMCCKHAPYKLNIAKTNDRQSVAIQTYYCSIHRSIHILYVLLKYLLKFTRGKMFRK